MSPDPSAGGAQRPPRPILQGVLVAALAALAYANTLPNLPVLDDGFAIFDNPLVKDLSRVPEIFRQPWGVAGPASVRGTWRPLTTLTFALNYAVGGGAVAGYHLVNLLLHALASVLVWAFARRLAAATVPGRAHAAGLVAGALFAVHPVHVEAVAGMVGRAESMSALGVLAVLLLLTAPGRPAWRLPAAAGVLALALLGKENAAVTPALLVLVGLAAPAALGLAARPGFRTPAARRAALVLAGQVALLGAVVLAYVALRPLPFAPPETQWFRGQPRTTIALTMTRVLAEYLRLLVWPHPLGVDFYYAWKIPTTTAVSGAVLASTAAWLAVLGAGVVLLFRRPIVGLGILWIFVALLPVLNVLVPVGALLAERLLYLPSVGFALAAGDAVAGALAAAAGRRRLATAIAGAVTLALAALAAKTVARNAEWRNGLTLWEAELGKAPLDAVVNNNLAVEYNARGEYRRALARLDVALATAPWYWRAHVNRGISLKALGDLDGAERAYAEAARIDPASPDPPFWLGMLLLSQGRNADALAAFEHAAALGPWSARVRTWKAKALLALGRPAEARAALEEALRLDPGDAEARALLGRAAASVSRDR